MKVKRKIIEIDEELCDGCGNCVPSCAEGAIQIIDGRAKIVSERFCDGLGACLGECPQGALRIVDREAEEFDEEAVEAHVKAVEKDQKGKPAPLAFGCPSAQVREIMYPHVASPSPGKQQRAGSRSNLLNWPVQIRLVPPNAPFLDNADLLVAADCTPVAYPAFHQDFLAGKVVLMGCPKLDDADRYIHKFAEIFTEANVKSVTVLVMEVPCCGGLPHIVAKGMERAGKQVPLEVVVINAGGEVSEQRLASE